MSCFALLALLLLPSDVDVPGQVVLEVKINEVEKIGFDLGFKLGCAHEVEFTIEDPLLLQPFEPPATTKKQSFEFQVLGFGTTDVTATFTGPGGDCVGMASDTVTVVIQPDLGDVVKEFKAESKATGKTFKTKVKDALDDLEDDLDFIAEGFFFDGEYTESEATQDVLLAVVRRQAELGEALFECLQQLGDTGSTLAQDGSAMSLPSSLASGTPDSRWDAAIADAQEAFASFLEKARKPVEGTLEYIEDLAAPACFGANLRQYAAVNFDIVAGPSLTDDPTDEIATSPQIAGLVGWSNAEQRGISLMGVSQDTSLTGLDLRITGPGGLASLFNVATETQPGTELLVFVTAHIIADVEEGISVPAGNWRVELLPTGGTEPYDVAWITVP